MQQFKSEIKAAQFHAHFLRLLETWECAAESMYVSTDFGVTHILSAGTDDQHPLVLVPGAQGTAAMWSVIANALADVRTIYALDIIDQPGRSTPSKVLGSPEDASDWLQQTVDGLGLTEFDLAGNSIGSYIAASFAHRNPARIRSLTLTAPAATFAEVNPRYIFSVVWAMLLPGVAPKKRFLRKISSGQLDEGDPLFDLLLSAMTGAKNVSKLIPGALGPDEITRLSMPLHLILGENDPVNALCSTELAHEIETTLPGANVHLIAGAGHLWTTQEFRQAAQLMRQNLLNS